MEAPHRKAQTEVKSPKKQKFSSCKRKIATYCKNHSTCGFISTHHSGSTGVMSIRGGAPKGKDVGLAMTSSSGVRDLSPWRHDSGGSCRLPEKRRLPRRRSTPSVQDGEVKDSLREQSEDSLLSWEETDPGFTQSEMKQGCSFINMAWKMVPSESRHDVDPRQSEKSRLLPVSPSLSSFHTFTFSSFI